MRGPDSSLLRVLDANLNRAREGLRVCEEVARLVLEDPLLMRRCQRLRYGVDRVAGTLPRLKLLQARDARGDVGRPSRRGEVRAHRSVGDLTAANLRRVQEALRVLEEFTRLKFPQASRAYGSLRFRAYSLEQAFSSAGSSLRHR